MSTITMRTECKYGCGVTDGYIETKNGQDMVRCSVCNKHQYNAPKTETGRESRSVQTTHNAIKPKQRSRIVERANCHCERCGKSAERSVTGLQVGHILSVEEGHKQGLPDDIINSDENLIAECDECNLGHGRGVLPVRLLVALLLARHTSL